MPLNIKVCLILYLKREQFKHNIEVASIGCGNMIDYWGLVEALSEIEMEIAILNIEGLTLLIGNIK